MSAPAQPAPRTVREGALSPELLERLNHWFDDLEDPTPSVSMGVFDREGLLHHVGVGEFQRDGRAPVPETIFRIASMTKSFCAACVLILDERGALSVTDPVRAHVPQFPAYLDPAGVEVPVTIEMLLTNSSGLPEDNAWADSVRGLDQETLRELLQHGLKFGDVPGTVYQYSNLGWGVLGLVVEAVAGEPFTTFAERELLTPLGLHRTRFSHTDFPGGGEPGPGIAHGFESFDHGATWFERPFGLTDALACAGSIFSTVPDIARWSAWLSSAFDRHELDDAVLSRKARRRMQRISTPSGIESRVSRPSLLGVGYGMGLVCEIDAELGSFAQHSGGLPGFTSNMRWHTESGVGVVVFTNTNGQKASTWAMEVLAEVMRDAGVPARRMPLWPETLAAAVAIDDIVRGGKSFADGESLYASNVLEDRPADVRDKMVADLISARGGLVQGEPLVPVKERLLWAASSAQVVWRIPCQNGDLQGRLEMTPLHDTLIQRVEIEEPPLSTDPALVVHRYVPQVEGCEAPHPGGGV